MPARIIIFGPHPDDQEIGMGGAIAKLADLGHEVLIVDVTDGSPTPRGDRSTRLPEAQAALAALQPEAGAQNRPDNPARPIKRILLDLPNRMVEHTLRTRHLFAGAIRAHQANVVFTPWPEDAHPDHRAVTRAAEDARFDAKLTKVEMPAPPGFAVIGPPIYPKWLFYYHVSHLRATITPHFLLDVSGYEQKKLASIRAYRSQFGPWDDMGGGPPTPRVGSVRDAAENTPPENFAQGDPKALRGRMVTPDFPQRMLEFSAYMGSLIGTAHAEPFFTKEPIGLGSLAALC